MEVKIGDRVRFMNDVGEGRVTKILDDETASVLNQDGFEYPMLKSELLVIPQEEKSTGFSFSASEPTESETVSPPPAEEEPYYTGKNEINLYLAFVPKKQDILADSDSDIFLINDSDYYISYNIAKPVPGDEKYRSITGVLEPNLKEKIDILYHDTIKQDIEFQVQILFFDKKNYRLRKPLDKHLKIKDVKFYKNSSFKENDFFDEKALVAVIKEENAMQEAAEKIKPEDIKSALEQNKKAAKKDRPRIGKRHEKMKIREADLHIHELLEDDSGMSDKEKLDYQLDTFHAEMKSAIKDRINRIVFIHGVGNGKLKHEIRRELQRKYPKYPFQDASFKEYGYGATMVILSPRK